MLEHGGFDQGSGLRKLALRCEPTVLSVLHHGDTAAELTLLWQLCASLQAQGYSVTVVDGTAEEGPDNPGLLNLLDQPYGQLPAHDMGAWSIVPSARGLAQLQGGGAASRALERLKHLLGDASALVLYAGASDLGPLLRPQSGLQRVVLPLSPEMPSLLSAYQGLKQLAQQARVAEVMAVTVNPGDSPEYLALNIARSLQTCTMNFLKCAVRHYGIQVPSGDAQVTDGSHETMRQLILHLLDPRPSTGRPAAPAGAAEAASGPLNPTTARPGTPVARPRVAHDQRLWSH